MTDQHPLTDKICFDIQWNPQADYQDEVDLMRAAADWQLEQVVDWLRNNLRFGDYLTPVRYEEYEIVSRQIDVDEVIEDLQKAMRPTNTQENN